MGIATLGRHAKRPLTIEDAQDLSRRVLSANPADAWDRYADAQEAAWERKRASSTCADCEHCQIAPESQVKSLEISLLNHINHLYVKREGVVRTDESLEYSLKSMARSSVRLCAWCDELKEFVDADDDAPRECDEFLPC